MPNLLEIVVSISIGATVFFLLAETIIMPFFNGAYNFTVTGLSTTTTQGLLLLVFVLGLIAVALRFMATAKIKKR